MEEMLDIVFKPCKNCKAENYDNSEYKELIERPDGYFEIEPDKCDKCDFSLALSDSDLLH